MARGEESRSLKNVSSSPESEAEAQPNNVGYPNQKLDADLVVESQHVQNKSLPFCFVKIWPKDAESKFILKDAVRLFQEMDQRAFQISEKIRDKVFHREEVLYRLRSLKKSDLYGLNQSIQGKKDSLTHLYRALHYFSFPLSYASEEKLEKHKLNFRIQHKTKTLAQEKQLYRETNASPKRNNYASTSLMAELNDILWMIPGTYKCCYKHYNRSKYEKLVEDIKQFQATRKISEGSRKTMRNVVKVICDDLTDMGKKKREVEIKIESCEKELEGINEEIWSIHEEEQLNKDNRHRKEASIVIVEHHKILEFRWFLRYGNLQHGSIDSKHVHGDVKREKTFLYWARAKTSFDECT